MARTEDPYHFLDLAFGYYMIGRFAVINRLYLAPNLMHHAVELLIKFRLLKGVPESQRSAATEQAKQRYRHNLNKLWSAYKQHVTSTNLTRFDAVIAELHRWENVRYGGFPIAGKSVAKSMGLVRSPVQVSGLDDIYTFGLDVIDELVETIFASSGINPAYVGTRYASTELPEWYKKDNKYIMPGLLG